MTLLLVAALLVPGPAGAGFVFVEDNGDQTLVQRGRMRLKPRDPNGSSFAMDLGRARMWMTDPARGAYWEGTVEEFCATARGTFRQILTDAQRDVEREIESLPPAERERARAMLRQFGGGFGQPPAGGSNGARKPPRVTVERTAETETIVGLATRKYRILSDGRLYEELWLTTDSAVASEMDPQRASETVGRMMACMLDANPRGGPSGVEDDPEYRKLYLVGWPLRSVYHGGAGASGRSTILRADRRELSDAEFAPPAGLRRVSLGELLGIEKR
ncbi:MAG: hypothetical protein ACRELS_21505 [Candidatus Rokuibacteriota bacterium]